MTIHGNIEGIRKSSLQEMEDFFELLELGKDEFAPEALLLPLARFTAQIGREISVYLGRGGSVLDVTLGNADTVSLPDVRKRRSLARLSGVRCLHTHPNGDPTLSEIDLQTLSRVRFDAMACIGVREDGSLSAVSAAFLSGEHGEPVVFGPVRLRELPQEEWMRQVYIADERVFAPRDEEGGPERAFLVGLGEAYERNTSLQELEQLAITAGAVVIGRMAQARGSADPATFIGRGKAEEVMRAVQSQKCDLVIFDDELSAAQVRNLEEILGVRVIDRTALILDIFAQRANSREGKLQVELAQLRYQLPRLMGLGTVLSRLGGGIGTRGPGETQLEVDRRRIRQKITDCERALKELGKQRALRRKQRERNEIPVVALVGYTNAGKSTLLNQLSGSDVLVEDKLFATLDPVTRKIRLPAGEMVLLVDTVGFISKLPHDLVQAFHSTLEEAVHADVLVIVSDGASPQAKEQHVVVEDVLAQLGATDQPRVIALNKIDRSTEEFSFSPPGAIPISARDGTGCEALLLAIEKALASLVRNVELFVPFQQGQVLSYLHAQGKVIQEEYTDTGTNVVAVLDVVTEARARHMLE